MFAWTGLIYCWVTDNFNIYPCDGVKTQIRMKSVQCYMIMHFIGLKKLHTPLTIQTQKDNRAR